MNKRVIVFVLSSKVLVNHHPGLDRFRFFSNHSLVTVIFYGPVSTMGVSAMVLIWTVLDTASLVRVSETTGDSSRQSSRF